MPQDRVVLQHLRGAGAAAAIRSGNAWGTGGSITDSMAVNSTRVGTIACIRRDPASANLSHRLKRRTMQLPLAPASAADRLAWRAKPRSVPWNCASLSGAAYRRRTHAATGKRPTPTWRRTTSGTVSAAPAASGRLILAAPDATGAARHPGVQTETVSHLRKSPWQEVRGCMSAGARAASRRRTRRP